jgi:hypothetical protein
MIAALAHPDIEKVIQKYSSSFSDEQHRFHSWNHCFTYFNSEKPFDAQIAALHLAFYLASWGMYRGSSFLLWKDYTVHIGAVAILTKYKCLAKIDFLNLEKSSIEYEKIFELKEELVKYYLIVRKNFDFSNKRNVISDTLVTKVMLGALGCVPAYDRYFKQGVNAPHPCGTTFNGKNFWTIIEFYKDKADEFMTAQTNLGLTGATTMRLVDMYFWQVGYDNSPKQTKIITTS